MDVQQLIQLGHDLTLYKLLSTAFFALLIYDYLLTFKYEVQLFWKQQASIITGLFVFNRYYHILSGVVMLLLQFYPILADGNSKACHRLGRFIPIGFAFPAWAGSALIMTSRVYAFYHQNRKLLYFLLTYLCITAFLVILPYTLPGVSSVSLPPIPLDAYQVCIVQFSPKFPGKTGYMWIIFIFSFDAIVLSLMLYRFWFYERTNFATLSSSSLLGLLLRDGIVYFVVVFSFNFTLMWMLIFEPPSRQFLLGIPSVLMSAVMGNRIAINLRRQGQASRRLNTGTITDDSIELSNWKPATQMQFLSPKTDTFASRQELGSPSSSAGSGPGSPPPSSSAVNREFLP